MTVWIDRPIWPRHGTVFAHLVSDAAYDELHAVARAAGLDPRGFDGDHYDVPAHRYAACVVAGARVTDGADLVRRHNASGLRLRKRKGDKGVARIRGLTFPSGDVVDADLVLSPRPFDERQVGMAMCFVQDGAGDFAVVWAPRRRQWGAPGGWREEGETAAEGAVREIREECGLEVDPLTLRPVGWERFTPITVQQRMGDRQVLQLYAATVAERRPALRPETLDQPAPQWVDLAGFRGLCGGEFWWPVAERLFG
ncbi:MAG TPA: DUF4031 domain-containing protein [Dermatophilaceae bacterium]|nr:DUF4031 domain-containing protein [Dermatophilaceae bacterium]